MKLYYILFSVLIVILAIIQYVLYRQKNMKYYNLIRIFIIILALVNGFLILKS